MRVSSRLIAVLPHLVAVLALITAVAIHFHSVLSGDITLVTPIDTSDLIYPDYYYIANSLKSGIFPLWNPHQFAGYSMAGYPQYGLFYPINLLFWILPYGGNPFPYQAYEYLVLFHVLLAGCFMYVLGRGLKFNQLTAITMGIIYMFGSNMMAFLQWGNALPAFSWFPLVLLFTLRALDSGEKGLRSSVFGGLCLGMVILASPAQPTIMMLLLIGSFLIFMLWRERRTVHALKSLIIHFFVLIAVGLLIGSVSLLPVLEFSAHSIRFLGADGTIVGNAKMPLHAFTGLTISLKNVLGFFIPSYGKIEVGSTFIGGLPLLLAILSIIVYWRKNGRVTFFGIVCVISILYALGWLLPYIFYFVPVLNKIREPQRYLLFLQLIVPVLSGYALHYILNRTEGEKRKRSTPYVVLGAMVFVVVLLVIGQIEHIVDLPLQIAFLFIGCLFIVTASLSVNRPIFLAISQIVLVITIFMQMGSITFTYYDKVNAPIDDYYASMNVLKKFVPEDVSDPYRVSPVEGQKWPYPYNAAEMLGFYDTFGYGNPILYKMFNYRTQVGFDSKYYDLLNVKYFVAYDESVNRISPLQSDTLVQSDEISGVYQPTYDVVQKNNVYLFENKNRIGYARVVDKYSLTNSGDSVFSSIENPQFDIRQATLINEQTLDKKALQKLNGSDDSLEYTYKVNHLSANRISMDVDSNKDGFLVISELYYPGWKVYVNNKRQNLYEADGILRGSFVYKGKNEIEFVYRPVSVTIGLILVGVTILTSLIMLLLGRFVRRGLTGYVIGLALLFVIFIVMSIKVSIG